MSRPQIVENEYLEFLDELRESGTVNMFGAGPYLELEFNLSRADAKTILMYWMETFGQEDR